MSFVGRFFERAGEAVSRALHGDELDQATALWLKEMKRQEIEGGPPSRHCQALERKIKELEAARSLSPSQSPR
jgi:hypothetical protein